MSLGKVLVVGASGFLGSHVTKMLAAQNCAARILVREGSDTRATDHLELERHYGSVFDADTLRRALAGVDTVFYCVVDTRSWLRDTRPLWETNVHRLQTVLDVAAQFPLRKFVYTSSLVTIGLNPSGMASEDDAFNWAELAPEYVLTRVAGEKLVLRQAQSSAFPAVICNVSNTYGPEDYAPTPHGKMLLDAALGKLPFYFPGGGESVGIKDAARALILAAQRGRVGERYIVSERYLTMQELFSAAARAAGRPPPRLRLPKSLMYALAATLEGCTFLLRRDNRMAVSSVRLLSLIKRLDNRKAKTELGWQPAPVEQAVAEAIAFYLKRKDGC